jgi:hypothetical protein
MKKTHDNERERFDLHGGVTVHRGKPAYFDVAIHRPNCSSVIEYSDESLRQMGMIPSTLYPWWLHMEFTAEGHIPDKEKPIKPTTRGFFLEIRHSGELCIYLETDIDAERVLKPKPTLLPGAPGFRTMWPAAAASASASSGFGMTGVSAPLPPAGPTGPPGQAPKTLGDALTEATRPIMESVSDAVSSAVFDRVLDAPVPPDPDETRSRDALLGLLKEGQGLFDLFEQHARDRFGPLESRIIGAADAFLTGRPADWDTWMGDSFRRWANKCDQVVEHHCGSGDAVLMATYPLPTAKPANLSAHLFGGWCEARRRLDWLRSKLTLEELENPAQSAKITAKDRSVAGKGLVRAFMPVLTFVDQPTSREKILAPGRVTEGSDLVWLTTRLWVTNTHPSEPVRLLEVRMDEVICDDDPTTRQTGVRGIFWEYSADGSWSPLEIHPTETLNISCQFRLEPLQDSEGNGLLPSKIKGTIVFTDQIDHDREAGHFVWN